LRIQENQEIAHANDRCAHDDDQGCDLKNLFLLVIHCESSALRRADFGQRFVQALTLQPVIRNPSLERQRKPLERLSLGRAQVLC
jgi:hypothetical protein